MKRFLVATIVLLCTSSIGFAQQDSPDTPATMEDVQKYLEIMHSREMMSKMIVAMVQPMHQMMHEQYEKDKDKLPADFEARMNKVLDDYMKNFPWEEVIQAMVPVYQKHFTKGDVDHLVVFYSSPTGQKLIRELPASTAESAAVIMPIIQKKMEAMSHDVQQQVAEMIKESETKPAQNPPTSKN